VFLLLIIIVDEIGASQNARFIFSEETNLLLEMSRLK